MDTMDNIDDAEFIKPATTGYTIYTKSGCPNCVKIKKYLCECGAELLVVNCDEYLIENKEDFLQFIAKSAKKEVKQFPIIFFDEEYIGGYAEAQSHYEKMNAFSDDLFF